MEITKYAPKVARRGQCSEENKKLKEIGQLWLPVMKEKKSYESSSSNIPTETEEPTSFLTTC